MTLAIVLAGLVACGGGQTPPASGGGTKIAKTEKKFAHATIYLLPTNNVSTPCLIRTAPQFLEADRKKNEEVIWTIVDACGGTSATDVELSFVTDPFDGACVKKGKNVIRCSVRSDAVDTKYTVKLTGKAVDEDPELEIVQ